MTDLPAPDPQTGSLAHQEAEQARRDAKRALSDGTMDLSGLFSMSDQERRENTSHRMIGHMNLREALLALPHIGEKKTDEILAEVGLDGERHVDDLGSNERAHITDAVAARF